MSAFHLRMAVSAVALFAASPALADLTAQQVWDDWKAQMGIYGESAVVIGSETYENGTLTVTDLSFDLSGDDGSTVTSTLPELVLTENGDGTVSVTMSEDYPIVITSPADPETASEATEVALALRQTGLEVTVSGDPAAMTYDLSVARYALELDSVTEGEEPVPAEALLALNDVSGAYTSTTDTMREIAYDLRAASMDLLIDATSPEDGSQLMLSGKVNDVAAKASITLPLDPAANPDMMMMNGLALDGGYVTGGGQYLFEFSDAAGPTTGTFATEGSTLDVRFSKDAVAYAARATGVTLNATSTAMPIPIDASIAEYGLNFEMPLSRTDAPSPWAAGLTLRGLDLNDEIWAIFDPQALLPRDPATLALDLSGTATVLFDLMDPAQAEAMAAAPMPAEIQSVDINELDITFGGASVTGTGSFTLDNSDMTTFEGMPKPTGAVEFQLNGVKALINNLAAVGILPQDQVMVGLGMLGAFATEVGPDQLTSQVEVQEDGQVIINGNPLPQFQ